MFIFEKASYIYVKSNIVHSFVAKFLIQGIYLNQRI